MSVSKSFFGKSPDGRDVEKYKITNSEGDFIELLTYGATLQSIFVPDKNDVMQDVLLGFDDMDGHVNRTSYHGQTVGRFANRICGGSFTVDGKSYSVDKNENGKTSLHSSGEMSSRVWDAEVLSDNSVRFSCVSPDGTKGFPGAFAAKVTFSFTNEREIIIEYSAVSDKKTPVNMTNHAYFNLGGVNTGNVLDHEIFIDADAFTPMDADSIPSGEIRSVKGTPFDFTSPKKIGRDIDEGCEQLVFGKGYDHNFCLNNPGDGKAKIVVSDPDSGRRMEVFTTLPGVQFYTGNFLAGEKGKLGCPMEMRTGFCLETQFFPDSPNHPNFPNCIFDAGEEYTSRTVYKFGINK